MRLKTLIVALLLIMLMPLDGSAQVNFTFRDSLGSYKVQFKPYASSEVAARRLSKPLVAPAVEMRLGTAYCANTPANYTTDSWWDPSVYADQLGPNDPGANMPRWFTVGAEAGYWLKDWLYLGGTFVWTGGFSAVKDYTFHTRSHYYTYNSFTIMPIVRFAWVRRGIVQLYSSVGWGLNLAHVKEPKRRYIEGAVAYDFTFVGISVGRNLFGYLDIGAGQRGAVSVGLGYRFNQKK